MDTHALLWWAHEPAKLSSAAFGAIASGENDVSVSAVSAIEISTKARKGRLEYETDLARGFIASIMSRGFELMSVDCNHAERAGRYTAANQDPWDRLLAAQAQYEGLTLISCDEQMCGFGIELFW